MKAARRAVEAAVRFVGSVLDVVYPRHCAGCLAPVTDRPGHLCWDCVGGLDIVCHPFCERCGDPADGEIDTAYTCSWCRRVRPAFELARSAARYRGELRAVLHAFKYGRVTCLSRDLVPLLAACVSTHYARVAFDAVTAVPLHGRRARHRGYNQSALLAGGLGRALGLPYDGHCLRRVKPTTTQTHLSARQRQANVRNAFAVTTPEWVDGRTLLLIDDVMTTGATTNECARVLREAGAAGVYVVTVARG